MKNNDKKWVKVAKKLGKIYLREIVSFIVGLVAIIIWLLKEFVRNAGRLIVGLYGIGYIVIPNLISKIKTPKLIKITIIYLLIFGSITGVYATHNVIVANDINKENKMAIELKDSKISSLINKNTKLSEENKSYVELKKELEQTKYELQKLRTINSLNNIERDIYNKGIEVGLSYEQSIMIVAISKHETGHWKSPAFIEKNNFGGVMASYGIKIYVSYEEGLDGFVTLLKNRYFDKGLDTIEKIQPIYCPIGAKNDPNNKNIYWLPTVTKFYNEYLNK